LGDIEPTVFDDDFVAAATVREGDAAPLAKPSRASLREVKREARERARGHVPGRIAPRRTRRLRQRLGAAGLVVFALGGVAYAVSRLPGPPHRHGAAPIVVPSYSPPPRARSGDAFAGSKVARWPVGAAGVKAPAATAVGAFSAAQVDDAYRRTAAFVRAALLDKSVLYGGATAPVYRTLGPTAASTWRTDPARLMTRFDPRFVKPASAVVRVNGRMTAAPGKEGMLQVNVTYVAVYALRPVHGGDTELVAVRRIATLDFARAGVARVGTPWVSWAGYTSDHSRCVDKDPFPGYVAVFFDSAGPTAAPDQGDAKEDVDILDPTATEPDGCFNDTSGL